LAGDLKAVWRDPTTDVRLKKRIVRELIREVIADLDEQDGEIILVVHWMGGVHTELRLPRRRRGQRNSTVAKIVEAVRALALVCSDDVIAGLLNRNGLRTGHGNRTFLSCYAYLSGDRCSAQTVEPGGSEQWW
jgi:hypothetical protein